MYFVEDHIYHIYNQGNNTVPIFFFEENYHFFLKKIRLEIKPVCEILAYCLMPNHFHLMVQATCQSCETTKQDIPVLARKTGTLLSSYTQAINKQNDTTGSLFRQKTKAKNLTEESRYPGKHNDYVMNCFEYLHNNPVKAGLVDTPEQWPYSSYSDYLGMRNDSICNFELAVALGLSVTR